LAQDAADRLDRVIHANLEIFDWRTGLNNEGFDCIVFADVLEHLTDPQRQLCNALGSLNTGGSIVISLPNIRHLSAFTEIYCRGRFPLKERGLFDATHLRWFTIFEGRKLLESSGLLINAEVYSLRLGDKGGGLVNKILNRLPLSLQAWLPIREFLTYQFCLRAARSTTIQTDREGQS